MIVREAKLKNGTKEQYLAFDEAIRTAQFIRNKAVGFWMDNQGANKAVLYALCKDLAKEFSFAKKLNSAARQAMVICWFQLLGGLQQGIAQQTSSISR